LCDSFTRWADDKMLNDGWSPDIVVGQATKEKLFPPDLIPSTSTLYHWIDRGIMKTENIDLLGPSIEDRPDKVDTREHFGHWEIDTLIGAKTKEDPVLLTLVERKTRFEIIFKINQKSTDFVN